MKAILVILLLFPLVYIGSGCQSIINNTAFYPDTVTYVPVEKLPPEVSEKFITTTDGVKIQCYFIPDTSSQNIVIYFHGNAGNISHRLPDLIQIRQFGVSVLGIGYRGYGKSKGRPSEKGIYLDGEAALSYAINELGFSESDIYVFGRSIGTTVAINTAQNRNIAGLILVSPLTSGKEQAQASGLRAISLLAGRSFSNISRIENITCPVLIIHGTHDEVIPVTMGVEIYESLQTKKILHTIYGAGHNNISVDFKREYWNAIEEFLANCL